MPGVVGQDACAALIVSVITFVDTTSWQRNAS
jgi:hypothetical protein